jgi:hypothetical protein
LAREAVERDRALGLEIGELTALAPKEGGEGVLEEHGLREAELAEGGAEACAHA